MPIIQTETIYFLREAFKVQVRVNKDGIFRINYPPIIINSIGLKEATGETIGGAFKVFHKTLNDFEASRRTKRKVILYEIDPKNHFSKGISLSVCAGVFIESCTIAGNGEKTFSYSPVHPDENFPNSMRRGSGFQSVSKNEADKKLDFTQKRFEFFLFLYNSMSELKNKLSELSEDKEKLLKIAETGKLIVHNQEPEK